jgi:hypothetical protein
MGWNLFESLDRFLGRTKRVEVEESEPLQELDSALERLKQVAEQVDNSQDGESFQARMRRKKEEQRKRNQEIVQNHMRLAIEAVHQELQSGISPQEMDRLHTYFEDLQKSQLALEKGSLRQKIVRALVERIHQEVGTLAWQELMDLMEKANVKWPVPGTLAPSATAEEIEKAWTRNIAEDEISFLETSLPHTGDLLVGVVKVWRASYPEPDSWLYRETALAGVGAALRARHTETAVERVKANPDQYIGEVEEVIAEELALVQNALQKGIESVEEAHQVTAAASEICFEVVPTLVWKKLSAELAAKPVAAER